MPLDVLSLARPSTSWIPLMIVFGMFKSIRLLHIGHLMKNYIKKLYGTTEGVFTAYYFEILCAREKLLLVI